jgi:D-alanyl-D-alanine dipeptidase
MKRIRKDEELRRAFWKEQMEAADVFMMKIKKYPVTECGEPLISLRTVVERAVIEVEFAGRKAVNDYGRLFYLREGLIGNFIGLAGEMNRRGWVLRVEDAYRTKNIQKHLTLQENVFDVILRRVIWECRGAVPPPDLMFRRLSALTATVPKVGTHMSGSALDISVLNRDSRKEVERGAPYLELSELTPMNSPFISADSRNNRLEITGVMERHGFVAYPYEFWHYSSGDAYTEFLTGSNKEARYGPVDWKKKTGKTSSIKNACQPLWESKEVTKRIKRALAKNNKR